MISINIKDVPDFLKNSSYVNTIKIPKEYNIKSDFEIKSEKDLHKILNVLRFWKVTQLPDMVYEYALAYPEIELDFDKYFPEDSFPLIKEIKFLVSINQMPQPNITHELITETVIESDYVGLFRYAIRMELEVTEETLKSVAKHGSIKILKYIVENVLNKSKLEPEQISKMYRQTAFTAAKHGQLDIIKYLVNKNLYVIYSYPSITFIAAEHGHLDCLKYGLEIGDSWNSNVFERALENNHVDCIKFCVEVSKNPPTFINESTSSVCSVDYKINQNNVRSCIKHNNYEALKLVLDDNKFWMWEEPKYAYCNSFSSFCPYVFVVQNNNIDEKEALRYFELISTNDRLKFHFGKSFELAAKKGYFKLANYIYQNGGYTGGWDKVFINLGVLLPKKILKKD